MSRIFAAVPAHNEAETVGDTVRALIALSATVVVTADDCVDATADRARQAGAFVVERVGSGDKARALAMGLQWIAEQNPCDEDVVLLVDADVGQSAREVVHLAEVVAGDKADLAIGVLPPAGKQGGFGLVSGFARWVLWMRTGRRFRAPLSGQRAIKWALLRRFSRLAGGFGVEVGMTVDAMKAGARVHEVDVNLCHRYTGRTWRGFCHRARQGWHVFLASVGMRCVSLWTPD